jgi:hypothetical protein
LKSIEQNQKWKFKTKLNSNLNSTNKNTKQKIKKKKKRGEKKPPGTHLAVAAHQQPTNGAQSPPEPARATYRFRNIGGTKSSSSSSPLVRGRHRDDNLHVLDADKVEPNASTVPES